MHDSSEWIYVGYSSDCSASNFHQEVGLLEAKTNDSSSCLLLTDYPPTSYRTISVLQQGQWALFSSHGTKHPEWNLWAQANCISFSSALNSSKHTAHSSCSDDFQLNFTQLNLFDPLFFTPDTSVCNSLTSVGLFSDCLDLCRPLWPLLVSDFHCALSLPSNLCLASLAASFSFWSQYAWLIELLGTIDVLELRGDSWLLTYRQKEDLLVEQWPDGEALEESSHPPLWWNLLLLATSTPGSIPAIFNNLDQRFCSFFWVIESGYLFDVSKDEMAPKKKPYGKAGTSLNTTIYTRE